MGLRRRSCKNWEPSCFLVGLILDTTDLMKRHSILSIFIVFVMGSSCVTNKQYVFLQKDDVNKRNLPKDSVVREYTIIPYEYRIQSEDNLSVRFESLTPQEYDIFNRSTTGVNQTQNLNQ